MRRKTQLVRVPKCFGKHDDQDLVPCNECSIFVMRRIPKPVERKEVYSPPDHYNDDTPSLGADGGY